MVWKKKFDLRFPVAAFFLIAFTWVFAQSDPDVTTIDEEVSIEDIQQIIEEHQSGYYDEYGNWHSTDEEEIIDPHSAGTADPITIPQRDVWTEQQWEKAKSDLDYTRPEEKKKREREERERRRDEPQPDNDESSSWSFNWPQFPTALGQIIVFSVIILSLVFLIWRLFFHGNMTKDKKLKQATTFSLEHIEEHLDESDLDRFLRMAIEAGDYKSGIRILYLAIIKSLHENKMIKWRKEKTNFDYVVEMRTGHHYRSFRDVTRAFELVWYGEMDVNENKYQTLHDVFRKFLTQVSDGTKK